MNRTNLATAIRSIMEERGESVPDVAAALGVSRRMVYAVLARDARFGVDTSVKLEEWSGGRIGRADAAFVEDDDPSTPAPSEAPTDTPADAPGPVSATAEGESPRGQREGVTHTPSPAGDRRAA